jgi:hypothetical protein
LGVHRNKYRSRDDHDLETHWNRKRDFTGRLTRIIKNQDKNFMCLLYNLLLFDIFIIH